MCSISREQPICIFYCKEFNEENVRRLLKKIDTLEELCYDDDPKYSLLVTRVRARQFSYSHLHSIIF